MNELLLRRRVAASPVLPYDAEIEYLEGDGASYIDTGVYASGSMTVEIKLRAKTPTQAVGVFGSKHGLLYSIFQLNKNLSYSFRFQIGYSNANDDTYYNYQSNNNFNNDYVFELRENKFYLNTVLRNTFSESSFEDTETATLFTIRNGVDAVDSRMFNGRIYYCKISNGGSVVRDFIPVRVGTTGYMYDKVSGQLFGNAGSGSFILGNDI